MAVAAPVAVLGDENGKVTKLRAVRTEAGPIDASGRQSFQLRSGSEFVIEADWIIPALGFESLSSPPEGPVGELPKNASGGIRVDAHQMTSVPGVFAGGDLVHGPSPLLHTVRDARQAAQQIDFYITQQSPVRATPQG